MPLLHAVVMIDRHDAQVMQFNADQIETQKVKAHTHHTRQHGSSVRTEHEFFGEVCDALEGIAEILVTGPHATQADFRHYVGKHRPALTSKIVGWEATDHPTEGQLLAFARQYFVRHDRMAGARPPTQVTCARVVG